MKTDRIFYIKSLKSEECPNCDKYKKSGNSLCYKCFKQLPHEIQRALYRPIGAGYEDAIESAFKFLGD